MKTLICISTFMALAFSGCKTVDPALKVHQQTAEAVSQGVYATNDSMKLGRFDLAYKYSDQTTRLVTPPKNRIEIKGIYK